jgi:hypothetical protein
MWNETVIALAKPAIILVVASTCFKSIVIVELAAIATVLNKSTASSWIVNVAADAAELVTTILLITVVVDAGTVYSVVDDVAKAPRASALVVVAISYYLSIRGHP